MSKRRSSPISLTTLILCLCLGSLVILPMPNIMGLSMTDVSEINFENYSQFDQTDLDDDISIGTVVSATIDSLAHVIFRSLNLDITTSCLFPESPPPEHS